MGQTPPVTEWEVHKEQQELEKREAKPGPSIIWIRPFRKRIMLMGTPSEGRAVDMGKGGTAPPHPERATTHLS